MSNEVQTLDAETAVLHLVWGTEMIAEITGQTVDPVEVRKLARQAVGGRARLAADELESAFERVLAGSSLTPAKPNDVAASLATIELPVVCALDGLALLTRRGDQLELARVDGTREWVSSSAVAAAVSAARGPWLTAAPAAPLGAMRGEHLTPWQRLRALIALERDDLWIVLVYSIAIGCFTLATPVAVQALVGSVAFGTVLQPIVVLSVLLLVALGFQATLRALQTRVVEAVQQRLFVRTALDLAARLPRLSAQHAFKTSKLNPFFEIVTLQKTASVLLTDGTATVLQVAIGLVVLAFYHPALLAFALALVALVAVMVIAPARRGLSTSLDESYAKYDLAAWLQELVRPGAPFHGTSGRTLAVETSDALTRRYLTARQKHFNVVFGQTVSALALQVGASAALLGLGGWLVISRELTLGQLVAAELIVAAVTSSVAKAGKLLDSAYDLLTAVDKLGHLVDLPFDGRIDAESLPGQGPVRVEARGLAGLAPIDVRAGERVAVVGQSTLAKCLSGAALPDGGQVSLNGVETRRAASGELFESVALLEPHGLIPGSILDNVIVGRARVSPADARAALRRAGVLDELLALPDGLDTHVDAEDRRLDASQRGRVLVARALAGQPRLVVADLPLDAWPPEKRRPVLDELTRADAPWTLIAVVADGAAPLARACQRVVEVQS
jgi:ABC-type bacteriocin/lantibiotic exporter with double-glycine peptidase domain